MDLNHGIPYLLLAPWQLSLFSRYNRFFYVNDVSWIYRFTSFFFSANFNLNALRLRHNLTDGLGSVSVFVVSKGLRRGQHEWHVADCG